MGIVLIAALHVVCKTGVGTAKGWSDDSIVLMDRNWEVASVLLVEDGLVAGGAATSVSTISS